MDKGLDRKAGVKLSLRTPPSSSDGVRLLLSDRADLAVMDIHDLAIARERGRDLVAVMSVVGRPLASLIAAPSVRRPSDLQGRRVAVSGAPSDTAVTAAIVRADGGDPRRVRITPTGFATTEALIGGRAAAATGFLNEEGVALTSRGRGFRVFRLEDSGAPAYPELVLVATSKTIRERPELVRAAVEAIAEGTRRAVADPDSTLRMLERRLPGADRALLAARTRAALGAMLPPNGRAGSLDPKLMARWSSWEVDGGVVRRRPEISRLMTTRFSDAQADSSN
jgi:ABC-type nitrate/sulfonate/bicarbonate transport system substrate-binding protein